MTTDSPTSVGVPCAVFTSVPPTACGVRRVLRASPALGLRLRLGRDPEIFRQRDGKVRFVPVALYDPPRPDASVCQEIAPFSPPVRACVPCVPRSTPQCWRTRPSAQPHLGGGEECRRRRTLGSP